MCTYERSYLIKYRDEISNEEGFCNKIKWKNHKLFMFLKSEYVYFNYVLKEKE